MKGWDGGRACVTGLWLVFGRGWLAKVGSLVQLTGAACRWPHPFLLTTLNDVVADAMISLSSFHLPPSAGISVACQNERSQHKNRAIAMQLLRYDMWPFTCCCSKGMLWCASVQVVYFPFILLIFP